jgi:hypothetical protein
MKDEKSCVVFVLILISLPLIQQVGGCYWAFQFSLPIFDKSLCPYFKDHLRLYKHINVNFVEMKEPIKIDIR